MRFEDFRPYQDRMVLTGLTEPRLLVGAGLGLGKTAIALAIAAVLEACGDAQRVLVVAPLNVARSQWHTEARAWSFSEHLDVALCLGSPKDRSDALKADATVTVINVENLVWLLGRYPIKTASDGTVTTSWPFDCVILDESYLFSSGSSKRFKHLRRYTRTSRILPGGRGMQVLRGAPIDRLILLTATPAPNGLQKLWSQLCLIDDGERLGTSFTAFLSSFYFQRPGASRFEKPQLRAGADDEIHHHVADRVFVLRSKDYLDLPDIVHTQIVVPLAPKVRRQYDKLEREFLLDLASGEEVYAPSQAALQNKLMQVCNGAVITGDRRDPGFTGKWEVIHDAKIDVLEELASVCEDNLLVVYWFNSDLERLKKRFPHGVTLNDGDVAANLERWNAGKVRMMFLHPASGGVGINAQHGGATLVWFAITWDLYLWEQTLGRLHRSGQKRGVTVHAIVVEDSVEQRVARSLQDKASVQDGLLDYLAEKPPE